MNAPYDDERVRLTAVLDALRQALGRIDVRLQRYARDVQEEKTYLWENRADMDHVEKIATRGLIEQSMMTGEAVDALRTRLAKLLRSPYFGRCDFARTGADDATPIYVGVHHFSDERTREDLIYDWRAPVASLFYDYETGPAAYQSPAGELSGEIVRKRQFKIRDGKLELVLESAVNIMDDVLRDTLSQASEEGMKQIVATIQRDQNAIIRDAEAPVLVIQGVAGSGKTSIALHRIAFLLYRFKDTLTSKDILIISPNRVFGDYIANVLPELGEEAVAETGMEALAADLLDQKVRFQTFFEQTAHLLESDDEALRRRIRVKASAAFLETLDAYAAHVERSAFEADDLWIGRRLVPDWFIDESFRRHKGLPTSKRVSLVVEAIEQNVGIYYNYDLTSEDRAVVRTAVRKMCRSTTLRAAYRDLFAWMDEPDLFKPAKGGKLEYADVFPLIYLKMRLEGVSAERREVKHLIVDEMQDYTSVQYAVLARLFPCRKTILGDMNQAVNPFSASTVDDIRKVFPRATAMRLCRSYRSTWEIAQFAQRILPNPDLIALERHGEEPELMACRSRADETARVIAEASALAGSGHTTLGIVCRTHKQAERLHKALVAAGEPAHLLAPDSAAFTTGVVVCSAHLAKGLEFDRVLVPDVSQTHYSTEMDRHLLYVACTRAMHRLMLTHVGPVTPLLRD